MSCQFGQPFLSPLCFIFIVCCDILKMLFVVCSFIPCSYFSYLLAFLFISVLLWNCCVLYLYVCIFLCCVSYFVYPFCDWRACSRFLWQAESWCMHDCMSCWSAFDLLLQILSSVVVVFFRKFTCMLQIWAPNINCAYHFDKDYRSCKCIKWSALMNECQCQTCVCVKRPERGFKSL